MPTLRQLTFNAVYFLNVLLLFLVSFAEKVQLPVFLQVTGRMHPLVLHFPVTLLFLGLLIDGLLARRQPRNASWQETLALVYGLLAVGSALTALFGFFLYKEGGYPGAQMEWHKWLGVATSLLAAAIAWLKEKASRLYFPTLLVGAVVITATGHLGAGITHGEGFLTEPLRRNRPETPVVSADSAVVFRDVIQPILNEKCAACHNPNKAKNRLIVTDYAGLVKGGETEGSLVPGKAEKSLLYTYALLPMGDSLHMPPEGKPQLDAEELKLIGWWINSGAAPNRAYAAMPRPDSIHALMLARFGSKTGVERLDIAFADPEAIAALNTPYRTVQQLSATKPYLHVFMGSRRTVPAAELKELEAVRDQIVSLDLGNSGLKDADLRALAGFPHLKKLYLQHTAVTDAGVSGLSGLSYLETLNLSGTRVTAKLLAELPRWPALKTVFLFNTEMEEAQLAALQKAAPKLTLHGSRIDVSDTLYYAQLVAPEVKVDSPFFFRSATVTVKPGWGKVDYYYTLDGSPPGKHSTRYTGPVSVGESARLRMIAGMEGWKDSKPAEVRLLHLAVRPGKVTLETAPDSAYRDRLDTTLVDGIAGTTAHDEGRYLGFTGTDLRARFDFAAPRVLSGLSVSYLEAVSKAVLPPQSIEVWGGENENELRRLGTVQTDFPAKDRPAARHIVTLALPRRPVRYVRIVARNQGRLPAWHASAKTAKPLILIDEVAFH